MADGDIGIKVADGTFYPVLETGFHGRGKRLILTTSRDNQTSVQIDFYRSSTRAVEEGGYVGSLVIDNIEAAEKGGPEIEVTVGLDEAGNLNAEARDKTTGEHQTLSVSQQDLGTGADDGVPDFELEPTLGSDLPEDEELLTGSAYPIEDEDRRKTYMERRRSPILFILFLVLCLAVIGGATYFVYQYITGRPEATSPDPGESTSANIPSGQPATPAAADTPAAAATPAPTETVAQGSAAGSTQVTAAGGSQATSAESTSGQTAGAATDDGVWYTIRRGDTLWDISASYYRNPWFYPRIARHPNNDIKNPDLILAGFRLFIPRN